MKKIMAIMVVFLFLIPHYSSADEPTSEQKRVSAIGNALIATVKIVPKSKERYGVSLDPQNGSGFFISKNAIVTNWHVVVDEPYKLQIQRYDGSTCNGKTGYREEKLDLAIVTVDCEGIPLKIARSILAGQDAYAIGSAQIDFAVTRGIVANLDDMGFMVTDAHINHGNSGGPIVDSNGDVIGVAKAILKLDPAFTYAIQIDDLQAFIRRSGV